MERYVYCAPAWHLQHLCLHETGQSSDPGEDHVREQYAIGHGQSALELESGLTASTCADLVKDSLPGHRSNQTFFRDDAGDQMGRRNVECRVVRLDALGRSLAAKTVRDFAWIAVFDRNSVAGRQREVEGA